VSPESEAPNRPSGPAGSERSCAAIVARATGDVLMTIAIVLTAGGLYLIFRFLAETMSGDLVRYTLGARGATYTDPLIRHAVGTNWAALLIYLLLFGACSMVVVKSAYSKLGRRIGRTLGAALVVGGVADAAAKGLILWSLHPPQGWPLSWLPDSFWVYAPAALGTVKWCALAIAVLSVPAAVSSVSRLWFAYRRYRRYRAMYGRDWWNDALPAKPSRSSADDESQAAWRQAYWIPRPPPRGTEGQPTPHRDNGTQDRSALCLSGGGVRSACVAMGAMQTLSRGAGDTDERREGAPQLDDFDYIISVSGGGYSAGARLMAVQPQNPAAPAATLPLTDFFAAGSPEFASLRRRSSYLADSPAALLSALGKVFKNLLASLLMVFSIAVVLGWLTGSAMANMPIATLVPIVDTLHVTVADSHIEASKANSVAALTAIAIPLMASIVLKCVALLFEWASASKAATKWRDGFDVCARGAGLLTAIVVLVTSALPALSWLGSHVLQGPGHNPGHGAQTAAGLTAVVVLHYIASVVVMAWQKKDVAAGGAARLKKFLPAGVVQIGLVLLTLLLLSVAWLVVLGVVMAQTLASIMPNPMSSPQLPHGSWLFVALTVLLVLLSCVDVTSLSLHPFYRGRLARAFAVRRDGDVAEPYPAKEATWLDIYGHAAGNKPEFVFACAAAITDDDVRPAPGINAVSFVMGADYIGGPALGWLKTPWLRTAAAPRIQRDLTVQAAVAVSGAAFASAMGRQNKGVQTLLALSGARLGTWLPNPRFVEAEQENSDRPIFPKSLPSVRGAGYFYRELFGIHHADARLVQITDGGHYENLGLVEALRRRCRLIYCIDAGGDTPPLLSGLDDAIRLAEFELGVQITFDEEAPGASPSYRSANLSAGTGQRFPVGHPFNSLNGRLAADAVARATIKYPEASGLGDENARTGCLIVAKAVLWHDLPDWVLTYAAGSEGQPFPHDNTFDQWFNEAQFAAYTEVGRRIAARALTVPPTTPAASAQAEPAPT
jgi:hypothetical protein